MNKMIPAILAFAVFAGSAALAEESKTASPQANTNTKQTTKIKKHHKRFFSKKSAKVSNNTEKK
jgi:hypothetical protein